MMSFNKKRLFFGDCGAFLVALFLLFTIRNTFQHAYVVEKFFLYVAIFAVITLCFYMWGLYDLEFPTNTYDLIRIICGAVLCSAVIAIIFLYAFGRPAVSPKTGFATFFSLFLIFDICWRVAFHLFSAHPLRRVLIIGSGEDVDELHTFFAKNPRVGYAMSDVIHPQNVRQDELLRLASQGEISAVIIQRRKGYGLNEFSYLLEPRWRSIELMDFDEVYETFIKKISLESTGPFDLAVHFSRERHMYEAIKRPVEMGMALGLLVLATPFLLCIVLAITFTSVGPVLYRQRRTGLYGKEFSMLKFRTMVYDAEKNGPQWSREGDVRVTPIGKILRWSHLDELPQLINILKGDMSFVGPRPERPEFITLLEAEIPLYATRYSIKPGVTGWAQINFRYTASVEDTREKLRYDLYYIKNKSAVLDVLIILSSVRFLFVNSS